MKGSRNVQNTGCYSGWNRESRNNRGPPAARGAPNTLHKRKTSVCQDGVHSCQTLLCPNWTVQLSEIHFYKCVKTENSGERFHFDRKLQVQLFVFNQAVAVSALVLSSRVCAAAVALVTRLSKAGGLKRNMSVWSLERFFSAFLLLINISNVKCMLMLNLWLIYGFTHISFCFSQF